MKFCSRVFAVAVIASIYALIGCAAPSSFSYKNVSLALTANCYDCSGIAYSVATPTTILVPPGGSTGGCIEFTAVATNAPATPTWTLIPTPNLGIPDPFPTSTSGTPTESSSQVGTVADPSGPTNFYCGPNGPPVYSGAALLQAQAAGVPQGDVLMVVSIPADPNNPSAVATATQLFQIYSTSTTAGPPTVHLSPSTPTGSTTSAVTVPRGTTYQFSGFAVGAAPCTTALNNCTIPANTAYPSGITYPAGTTINNLFWEVNGVIGGSTAEGFITQNGLYTAPAAVPATQPIVTAVSQSVATVVGTAYVTIQ